MYVCPSFQVSLANLTIDASLYPFVAFIALETRLLVNASYNGVELII